MPRSFDSVFYGAAGGGVDLPSDDEFNTVSFLSHFDGANNGVNDAFDDSSSNNHTISNTGSPTQGSFGPFAREVGYWGIDFINSTGVRNGVKLCEGYQAELVMTGTFTIEFWLFHRYVDGYQTFFGSGGGFSGWNSSTGHEVTFFALRNTAYAQFYGGSGNVSTLSITLNSGEWNHVALVNNGGNWTTYLNGVGNTTQTKGNVVAISSTSSWASYIGCGNGSNDNNPCKGIMSNVRFVKGTAVYTSNFTPSTAPLTAITNTSSLVAQNNRFVDNSSHANTVAPTGAVQITAFGPFLTSSVYNAAVNGASSSPLDYQTYLSIADGSWKTLGTGNFTWEFWFYGKTESAYMIGDGTAGTNVSSTFTLGVSGKRIILYYSIQGGAAYALQSPNSAPFYNLNEWHHVAYVRDGNDHKIYANGVLRTTETRSGTMVDSTGAQQIGNFGPGFSGGSATIFSDVRLVKGTAVYSGSTYTVPTAPLTAITNTQLLVNMANGQAIDSAAQNKLTLVNDAKTSTTRAKFGGTSLYLDGSDYATIENSQTRAFGTGDFTVELFIWLNGSPDVYDYIFDMRSSSDLTYTWALSFNYMGNTSDKLQWATNDTSATLVLSADYPSLNQWVHIAVCRSGTTTRMFYDGTQVAIKTSDTFDYKDTGYQGYIGCRHSVESYINAYMDEIRFSKTARYTSNFTAPTAAFPDKGQDA